VELLESWHYHAQHAVAARCAAGPARRPRRPWRPLLAAGSPEEGARIGRLFCVRAPGPAAPANGLPQSWPSRLPHCAPRRAHTEPGLSPDDTCIAFSKWPVERSCMPNAFCDTRAGIQDRRARLTTSICALLPAHIHAACDIGCLAKGQKLIVDCAYPATCKFQVPSLVKELSLKSAD